MLGGVSSSRSYQSLSSSPRKKFWMIGTTLGMKISLTSPSNSTHGSKIREKLSKKREAVWQWQPREGKLSTKAWRLRTLRTALWHSWPRTKNVVPSKNYSRTTPSFQQVYLTSWWGLCSHNCCFLRQTWLLTLTGVALEKWNSRENMGVNLVIAEVTNGEKKRLWLKPIRGPCFLRCHEEIWCSWHQKWSVSKLLWVLLLSYLPQNNTTAWGTPGLFGGWVRLPVSKDVLTHGKLWQNSCSALRW